MIAARRSILVVVSFYFKYGVVVILRSIRQVIPKSVWYPPNIGAAHQLKTNVEGPCSFLLFTTMHIGLRIK